MALTLIPISQASNALPDTLSQEKRKEDQGPNRAQKKKSSLLLAHRTITLMARINRITRGHVELPHQFCLESLVIHIQL